MNDKPAPIVLTFAASDPTGGAGVQADILTLTSLGCHAVSVLTAITVQDTVGVEDYFPLDADWIAEQARCLLEDMPVAAFKIGMVGSVAAIATIAAIVADYPDVPLIVDPVLASGRGDELSTDDMRAALMDMLIPQTTILTPNSIELRSLVQEELHGSEDASLAFCAQHILDTGCEYVLVTGTHENTVQVMNTLYDASGELRTDTWTRLPGSYHGSGCTLASAIAALLAKNKLDVQACIREAQNFTYASLLAGYRPGMGQYIPDRFYWASRGEAE